MSLNAIDQLLVPVYQSDLDPSSVPLELHKEVADYKRINSIILALEEAANPEGVVSWEATMEIFGMSQTQYGVVRSSDDMRNILHMGLGTEVEEVKGIGTSSDGTTKDNIYLGYSKHFPVVSEESNVTAERWHFIPRYNYPVVVLQVVPVGTTVGVFVKQGVSAEKKNELAAYYKQKSIGNESESLTIPEVHVLDFSMVEVVPVQEDDYEYSTVYHDDAYDPPNVRPQVTIPTALFQGEGEMRIELSQVPQLEPLSGENVSPTEKVVVDKPVTIEQKAQALLNKLVELSNPVVQDGQTPRAKYVLDVDDVLEALGVSYKEVVTSKKYPYLLLMTLMDEYFPVGTFVERIELVKKFVGDFKKSVVWRVGNRFDRGERIDITLVSPRKGGKWAAGSLLVKRSAVQPGVGRVNSKKTKSNIQTNGLYVQDPLFVNP